MEPRIDYPFAPKSTKLLRPGQFWSLPLDDGRFGCGRVLACDPVSTRHFFAATMDWIGNTLPTSDSIAGAKFLSHSIVHLDLIRETGGAILGLRPLGKDRLRIPLVRSACISGEVMRGYTRLRKATVRDNRRLPVLTHGAGGLRLPNEVFAEPQVIPMIRSPLKTKMLPRPGLDCDRFVLDSALRPEEYRRLAVWMANHYPNAELRVFAEGMRNLGFLVDFPHLKALAVGSESITTVDAIRSLPQLERLSLGEFDCRKVSLDPLAGLRALRGLELEGRFADVESLSALSSIERLMLRSTNLTDLSVLKPLENLWSLDLKLGGIRDLACLPEIGKLKYLELWLIRGLQDLSMVGRLSHLQFLFLQALRGVKRLPSFRNLVRLRRVHLETMGGLSDLQSIAEAPVLEELIVSDTAHLMPRHFACFRGHPTLRSVSIGLGSDRKNRDVARLLGLPAWDGEEFGFR